MRRELFIHFSFWFSIFVFVALFKQLFNLSSWPFWIGGLLGVILPDLDHFIYVYFVKPQELTSQRVSYLLDKKAIWRSIQLIYETRDERSGLIFHTILFQAIFLIFMFWMLTSSGSMFGRGLSLSFMIHLSVDQLIDLNDLKTLGNWFTYLPFQFDLKQSKNYWMISSALVLLMGFLM